MQKTRGQQFNKYLNKIKNFSSIRRRLYLLIDSPVYQFLITVIVLTHFIALSLDR